MISTNQLTPAQQIILFAVRHLPGQLGRTEMAKLLAGSKSSRLAAWQSSPHYGRLSDYTRHELTAQPDILLEQNLLAVDNYGDQKKPGANQFTNINPALLILNGCGLVNPGWLLHQEDTIPALMAVEHRLAIDELLVPILEEKSSLILVNEFSQCP